MSDTASVNIPLMAVRDLIDDGDVELLLSFQVIQAGDGDLNPSVFEGYRALTTNVSVTITAQCPLTRRVLKIFLKERYGNEGVFFILVQFLTVLSLTSFVRYRSLCGM